MIYACREVAARTCGVILVAVFLALLMPARALATDRVTCGAYDPQHRPWVALYPDINFGGEQVCFAGQGKIELINYGIEFEASSINIEGMAILLMVWGTSLDFTLGCGLVT